MKHLLIITLLFFCLKANAQVDLGIRIGYAMKTNEPYAAPSIGYHFRDEYETTSIRVYFEPIIDVKWESPATGTLNFSVKHKFIEAGTGIGYAVYSTDKYDSYKNHFILPAHVALYYKNFFIQYEYVFQNRISIGVRTSF